MDKITCLSPPYLLSNLLPIINMQSLNNSMSLCGHRTAFRNTSKVLVRCSASNSNLLSPSYRHNRQTILSTHTKCIRNSLAKALAATHPPRQLFFLHPLLLLHLRSSLRILARTLSANKSNLSKVRPRGPIHSAPSNNLLPEPNPHLILTIPLLSPPSLLNQPAQILSVKVCSRNPCNDSRHSAAWRIYPPSQSSRGPHSSITIYCIRHLAMIIIQHA